MAIFLFLLKDELNEYAYDAELAGISYSINATFYGILVSSIDYMVFWTPDFRWKGVLWNHHCQSVRQSFSQQSFFFSNTANRIFMKWHIRLRCLKDKTVTEPDFSEKNSFGGEKKPQNTSKMRFFGVCKKFSPLMCAFFGFT